VRAPLTVRELAGRRNMLILGLTLAATAVFAGWLWYSTNYLWRVAQGPEPATLAELTQMGPEGAGRWFEVTADVRPGLLLRTTRRSRRGGTSVTNHFALIKNKALLVETSQSALPPSFLAWASEFDEDSDYFKRARSQLDVWTGSARRLPMSPLLLRVSGSVEFTRWFVGLGISAVVLGLLVMYWRISRALLDYSRTPQVARLRKSVLASQGLAAMVGQIDQQLAALDPSARRTGPILLPSWLVTGVPAAKEVGLPDFKAETWLAVAQTLYEAGMLFQISRWNSQRPSSPQRQTTTYLTCRDPCVVFNFAMPTS
jgi:hypothetical protein